MKSLHISTNKDPVLLARASVLGLLALLLTGCATVSGQATYRAAERGIVDEQALDIAAVRQNPQAHIQSEVRWGGVVESVENHDGETWIEVVERPLNRAGQPQANGLSNGRFFAIAPNFLDPEDYRAGRALTVSGSITGLHTGTIGGAEYEFPKVAVVDHTLWLPSTVRASKRRPYYSPYRGSLSVGIGVGAFKSLRFGYRNRGFRSYRGSFHNRFKFGHRKHRGFSRSGFRRRSIH